jgi:hypothetical protein
VFLVQLQSKKQVELPLPLLQPLQQNPLLMQHHRQALRPSKTTQLLLLKCTGFINSELGAKNGNY